MAVFVFAAAILAARPEVAASDLAVSAMAEVPAGFIRLGDLVSGKEEKERFSGVFLGRIAVGETRSLSVEFIRRQLVREGYLTVYPAVQDGRGAAEVKGVAAAEAAQADGAFSAERAAEEKRGAGGQILAQAPAPDAKDAKDGDGKFEYAAPTEYIRRGTIITAEMLTMKSMKKAVPDAVNSMEEAVGMRAERGLQEGMTISRAHLLQPPMVEKNEWVSIAIEKEGIKIRGLGRAMKNGYMGEIIEVRRNRQTLKAKVTGPKAVLAVEE